MNDYLHYQSQLQMKLENAQRRRMQDAYPGRPEGPLEGPFDLHEYDRLAKARQNRRGEYDPFGIKRRRLEADVPTPASNLTSSNPAYLP